MAGAVTACQVQPRIDGTAEFVSIPMMAVQSSQAAVPPYKERFADLFNDEFLSRNRADLRLIKSVGSSLDSIDNVNGVVSALATSDPHQEWVSSEKKKG
jgi:hypothetical protein